MSFYWIQRLDTQIREKFERKGLKLRSAGNGFWLCSLLPGALCCNVFDFNEYSELYKIVSILGIGQFVCAVCNILNDVQDQIPFVPIGLLSSSTLVSLLLVFGTRQSLILLLSLAVLSSLAYPQVFAFIIRSCPRSFTYGEGTLIAQALILYLSSLSTNLFLLWFESSIKQCDKIASFVLQVGYFSALVLLLTAYCYPKLMANIWVFTFVLGSLFGIFVIGMPFVVMKKNSMLWLFQLISNEKALALIGLWLLCCLAAGYCLFYQCKKSEPASSPMRKSFHFLIFIVLVPGLFIQPCLTFIGSGVAFALLIVTEAARKLKLTSHANTLQSCFEVFKDEKDEGELALTPLYLMVGCLAPMWIYPFSYTKFIPVPVLAGLLTVAIGDAMASIGGLMFGRHRWPKSSKTIEGSCCCFISQILILLLLNSFGLVRLRYIIRLLLTFAVITVFEAKTDQIDNLALPFVSYTLLCWSS